MSWRDHLQVHPACEMFPPLSHDELIELGEDIKQNKIRERVKLVQDGDGYAVLDGRSRLDAIEAVGLGVRVFIDGKPNGRFFEVVDPDVDPFDFVVSANLMRRHMTNETKRHIVAELLKRFPDRSNRRIARIVGADHKTVGNVRDLLERRGEIPTSPTLTDATGREQSAHKPKPSSPETGTKSAETADLAAPMDPGTSRSDSQTQGGSAPKTGAGAPTSAAGQSAAAPDSKPAEGQPEPSTGKQQAEIRKADEERQRLLEQVEKLKQERRDLSAKLNAAMTDPESVAEALGAMPLDGVNTVMSRLVTDHIPADPRKRQEWSKDACGWIQLFYNKLAGPKENPWQWRQKVHRLIKLPPGIDAGKPSRDEIGDNPTTATEADLARQAAPPRPAELPKLSDAPDYRRLAAPGQLLKSKPPSGRNGLNPPPAEPSLASALPEGEIEGITSATGRELLAEINRFQGSAGGLMDYWRANRSRWNDLTLEEQALLKKKYQARFNELNEAGDAR